MRVIFTTILAALMVIATYAAPIDDAKALYRAGKYQEAVTKLKAIVKSSPANGTANYYLGMSYLKLGDEANAITPLKKAEDKGIIDAAHQLAKIAVDEYRFDDADEHIETWKKLLKKEKKEEPEILGQLQSRANMLSNMLQRVEKIVIVDSLVVDTAEFFKYYKLSDEAGKLYEGAFLPPVYTDVMPKMVYLPQSNTELFWGRPMENGKTELVSAEILDDGSVLDAVPMGEELGEGGDADYPFFASDGVTFYFANNGVNSIGGYDIYFSRRQPDGSVLEPQNLGMPYNSAYDDYMLVIDEAAGLGWWATDRNQIPGKVTIYVFVPNETRVNFDPNDPDLADYAFVRSVAATQVGVDYDVKALLNNPLLHSAKGESHADVHFVLSMGNGQVYTNFNQFKNPQARQTMVQYTKRLQDFEDMKLKLQAMREGYANGDKAIASEILSLEKRIISAEPVLKKLRNSVISLETSK